MVTTCIISVQQSEFNQALSARCQALGLHYLTLSPFSIDYLEWQHTLPDAWLEEQDGFIFLSPNAVKGFAAVWPHPWPNNLIAIGAGTQAELAKHTTAPILTPLIASSEGLLSMEALQNVHGKRLCIIKGVGGRAFLSEQLRARGADILAINSYQRIKQSINIAPLLKIWQNSEHPLLLATSFSALSMVCQQLTPSLLSWFLQIPLLVTSERLVALALKQGFSAVRSTPAVIEIDSFMNAIKEYL